MLKIGKKAANQAENQHDKLEAHTTFIACFHAIDVYAEVSFTRDIRPVLSEHCFRCHGFDESVREAGLRLDERNSATAELDSGSVAIGSGNTAESELVARIRSDDDAVVMLPSEMGKPLTERQKRLLEKWIEQGAKYGPEVNQPGTFTANCLLAWRMAEKGVRFVQGFHRGWDQHGSLNKDLRLQCGDIDQACAALVTDLKQRGMLDDTLVVWGGEFGRTTYSQGDLASRGYGRDHHPRCFTMWMAGGGVKRGYAHGETDEFCYNIVRDGVHVHDLNATMLHCLGINHERLTFRYQGRDFRLTDVHGRVVNEILL